MNQPSRAICLFAAIGLHAAVLWGVAFGPPAFIAVENQHSDAVEIGLVETSGQGMESQPEPPTAEPIPPETAPPAREPAPPISPEAVSEPAPKPPISKNAPEPKPKQKSTPHSITAAPGAASNPNRFAGSSGAGIGRPGGSDSAHATWRNRITPSYPPSARAAGQTGRVFITVNVNALGQASSVRIFHSSTIPALDDAALAAARSSTYNPRKLAGIPLPDTITVPYVFRLDER